MYAGSCPVHKLTSILLDNKDVSEVDENESLTDLCPSVQEIHLGNNSISNWEDVSFISAGIVSISLKLSAKQGQNSPKMGLFVFIVCLFLLATMFLS